MFTLDQIYSAHRKVKTGADFPAYIKDLKRLGVMRYETFVADGHTEYLGIDDSRLITPSKYEKLPISPLVHKEQFINDLTAHQQGYSDYPAFCLHAAQDGVQRWIVDIRTMTCTYLDNKGREVLKEKIKH